MKLDDPADFSIWAVVFPEKAGEFRRWMAAQRNCAEISVRQIFGQSLKVGDPVQICWGLGWREVAPLLKDLPAFLKPGTVKISETDLPPGINTPFCVEHQLYHRGKVCPVDADNFIKSGIRDSEGL